MDKDEIQGRSSRDVMVPGELVIQQSARAQWRWRVERDKLRARPLRLLVGLHGGLDNCGDMRIWHGKGAYSQRTLCGPTSSGKRYNGKLELLKEERDRGLYYQA